MEFSNFFAVVYFEVGDFSSVAAGLGIHSISMPLVLALHFIYPLFYFCMVSNLSSLLFVVHPYSEVSGIPLHTVNYHGVLGLSINVSLVKFINLSVMSLHEVILDLV